MTSTEHADVLPEIPVVSTGPDFPMATLKAERSRLDDLLSAATTHAPPAALRQLDKISRYWLKRWNSPDLPEIDSIAKAVGRPGAYFFSINYEWGCTTAAKPAPDHTSARLIRVLDWRTPGLGRAHLARLHWHLNSHGAGAFFRGAQSGTHAPIIRHLRFGLGTQPGPSLAHAAPNARTSVAPRL